MCLFIEPPLRPTFTPFPFQQVKNQNDTPEKKIILYIYMYVCMFIYKYTHIYTCIYKKGGKRKGKGGGEKNKVKKIP